MRRSILGFTIIIVIFLAVPISLQDTTVEQDNYTTDPLISPGEIKMQGIVADSFVSRWDTTKSGTSTSYQITLPIYDGGTYDFEVDWGDTNVETIDSYTEATHTYTSEGEYTVIINGSLTGWRFNDAGDELKIIEISQWGNINLGNLGYYFYGCENLVLTATDAPDLTGTTSLHRTFAYCYSLGSTGTMNAWDVSSVTRTDLMFYRATSFDQPIGDWNVSSVTDMYNMFRYVTAFNQPIGNWNISSVADMGSFLNLATLYHQYYDNMLIQWSALSLQPSVPFHAGNSQYSSAAASAARQFIINTYSWTITDGGPLRTPPPDLSNPENIEYVEGGPDRDQIEWDVGDTNPDYYNITKNGILLEEGTWTNGTIVVDVYGLTEGIYEFELSLFNIYGNTISDFVVVDVNIIETITETETETETNTMTVTETEKETETETETNTMTVTETEKETETETETNTMTVTETEKETDTVTDTDVILSTLTEYITTFDTSDLTNTTDAPILFTFVILGLAVFVLRRRH